MSDHRRLEVWRRSKAVARRVHLLVWALPRAEQHRLGDQIIRSANSVPNNLAQGANAGSDPKYLTHVHYSIGSANELYDQLIGLAELKLLRPQDRDLLDEVMEICAMLKGLARWIESRISRSDKKRRARP